MSRRTDLQFLEDIVERIEAAKIAEKFLVASEGDLLRTSFDAILYDLLIIGEAVKRLGREITERNSQVAWKAIAGMRDVLAHDYFRVFSEVVTATLDEPLEILKQACLTEISRIQGSNPSKHLKTGRPSRPGFSVPNAK